MRSGISHLYKRMNGEGRQDMFGAAAPATEREAEPRSQEVASELPEVFSELDAPLWSVVSFDKHEAGGLNYRQAAALMTELDRNRVHGLCIITDNAAKRYAG